MKLAEEPIGQSRERFYEMKAALGLAWYCAEKPQVEADGSTTWRFRWNPPEGVNVEPQTLVVGRHNAAFEELCDKLEDKFCQHELGLVCECCALDATDSVCPSCRHSIGFHRCEKRAGWVWRKGTLHSGVLDAQRVRLAENCFSVALRAQTKTLRRCSSTCIAGSLVERLTGGGFVPYTKRTPRR